MKGAAKSYRRNAAIDFVIKTMRLFGFIMLINSIVLDLLSFLLGEDLGHEEIRRLGLECLLYYLLLCKEREGRNR